MKESVPIIIEITTFVLLVYAYVRLCMHRDIGKTGKILEIISLYGVSIWALLGNLKFYVWALMIAAVGLIKILTTKKQKIERRNKGYYH